MRLCFSAGSFERLTLLYYLTIHALENMPCSPQVGRRELRFPGPSVVRLVMQMQPPSLQCVSSELTHSEAHPKNHTTDTAMPDYDWLVCDSKRRIS